MNLLDLKRIVNRERRWLIAYKLSAQLLISCDRTRKNALGPKYRSQTKHDSFHSLLQRRTVESATHTCLQPRYVSGTATECNINHFEFRKFCKRRGIFFTQPEPFSFASRAIKHQPPLSESPTGSSGYVTITSNDFVDKQRIPSRTVSLRP